jgi:subtilisin family serine protease
MDSGANPLDLVALTRLMRIARGSPDIAVGLIDGPVALDHPALTQGRVRQVSGAAGVGCKLPGSVACAHGTFIAGVLSATRGSGAPAICPDCTLLVRPIFAEGVHREAQMPNASPDELAVAIIECVGARARVVNLSVAVASPTKSSERALVQALDYAARRGVIVVTAAGNQGTVGGSPVARHPWVIAVAACDLAGRPLTYSNLGNSIGRRGLSAPGHNITSLGVAGGTLALSGTSVAAPFVTGAVALLWSLFPTASAGTIKSAVAPHDAGSRRSVAPPLLDAWRAYVALTRASQRVAPPRGIEA